MASGRVLPSTKLNGPVRRDDEVGEPELRFLTGKVILLISPQPWDHLKISKHHYGETLARYNDVYFLEPPRDHGLPGISVRSVDGIDRLSVVSWRAFFPRKLRFHAYGLYRWLIGLSARWIVSQLDRRPDIVWCFDFNMFPDLNAFGARTTIFHPVDPLTTTRQVDIGNGADLIVSVSPRILSNFDAPRFESRTLLINHGLSAPFADLAENEAVCNCGAGLHCGYFGNLDRTIIDLDLLTKTVLAHRDVTFHFWGPHTINGPFARAISGLGNTVVHGARDKDALACEIAKMDLFVLTYRYDDVESDRSNAHKILEYMSTGKITVTTKMDCYCDKPDLVRMSRCADDSDFVAVFTGVVADIENINSPANMTHRKAFSRQYTYGRNLARIDEALVGADAGEHA